MKRLNIPLLLVLIIGSLVLAVGTHLLHGYQVSRNSHQLLERAKKADERGDVDEQVRILRRYLRHCPEDTEQLKVLLRATKDRALSVENVNVRELMTQFNALEKAIRENPTDTELRRLACEFALHRYVQRFTDALSHLKQIESQGQLTTKDRVTQAQCLEYTSKQDQAIELLCDMIGYDRLSNSFIDESVSEEDKKELTAYMALLFMLKRASQVDIDMVVANTIMDRMIEVNQTTDAYLNRATFYQTFYEGREGKEKSLADINKAMELAKQSDESSPRILLAAATTLMALGDFEPAQELLDEALAKYPSERRIYNTLADLAVRKGENEKALDYVEQGLAKLNLNPELLYQRANLELEFGRIDDCKKTLKSLQDKGFDKPRIKLVEARMMIAQNDFRGAATLLEKLRPMMRHSSTISRQIDMSLMICYKRLGFNDKIPQIAQRLGNQVNAMFDTAQSMALQGQYDEALDVLKELQKKADEMTPEGRAMVFKLAMDIQILRQQQVPEAQRDWSVVDGMANRWLETQKLRPEQAEDFRISLLIKKGQTEEAHRRAQAARLKYENYASFWMYLNNLTKDYDQGMSILDQMKQRFNDSWTLRAARANRIVAGGRDDALTELAKLSEGIDKFSPADQAKLRTVLANSYARLNDFDKSIEILRQMLVENKNSLPIRNSMFEMAFKSGNLPVMEEMLNDLEKISGRQSTEWQVAQIRRLLWEFDNGQKDKSVLPEVRDLAEKVREKRPDWATVYVLQADVSIREGNPNGAETYLKTALEKRPGDVQTIKQLANVYTQLGRPDEAEALMSTLPDSKKLRSDLMQEIQIMAFQDPAKALVRAEELIAADSNDVQELIFLAEIQMLNRAAEQALETLKRAVDADPTQTGSWMRYVQLLVNLGQREEASAAVKQLQLQVAPEQLPLLLGQCHTMLGDYPDAEAAYAEGLRAKSDDPVLLRNLALLYQVSGQDAKNQTLLKKLMALQGDGEAKIASAWARRETAKKVAASMAYKDFLAALKLLEQNADAQGNLSGEDLQLWLTLCAHRPEAPSRQKAVNLLNQIQEKRSLTNGEKAILAYVYKKSDRWSDAEQIMLDILAEDSKTPVYINTYVSWLLERDDLSSAAAWLKKLPPTSIEFLRFNSQLLVRTKKAKEANRILLELTKDATQADAGNVRAVAGIMEELGQFDPRFYKAAERQWTKYLQLNPKDTVGFIQFLARVPNGQRLEQALKLCEAQIAKAAKAGDLATMNFYINLGLKGLRRHRKSLPQDSPHYARVERWFPVARKTGMDDIQVTWTEIDFHDIRGDFDKLEVMYRDFLKRDSGDQDLSFQKAVVRNNLAFQLAINNRGQEALSVIGDAISQLGPRSDFLDTRAMAYYASGDVDSSVKDLRTAVSSGTATAAMYFHLALVEFAAGNQPQAIEAMKQALQMDLKESDLTTPEILLLRDLKKKLGPEIDGSSASSELELSAR